MPRPVKKILVFRLGAMGDILFTTPALRGLNAKYPGCHLTYLTLKQWRFLLKGNPNVDRVVGLSYCDPRALGSLARESFDLLLNFLEGEKAAQTCQAIPARERLGNQWRDDTIQPDASGFLFSHDKEARQRQLREGLSYAALYCRIAGVQADSLRFEYHPGRLAEWRARRFLAGWDLARRSPPIALHLHSRGSTSRSWAPERALEVVRAFPKQPFLILGYEPDRPQTRLFETEPNARVSYHVAPVQAGLLRHCALFVGIDSGPRNLASAMGPPAICLSGPYRPPSSRRFRGTSSSHAGNPALPASRRPARLAATAWTGFLSNPLCRPLGGDWKPYRPEFQMLPNTKCRDDLSPLSRTVLGLESPAQIGYDGLR